MTGTTNALTSSDLLYNGLTYVIQHPFVNDPIRPGKVDRVIAASFAFGTTQTFQSEVDAFKNYPQIVIALKNAYHKFLKEGIAPDRGRRRIWRSARGGSTEYNHDRSGGGGGGGGGGRRRRGRRRHWRHRHNHRRRRQQRRQSAVGDSNGMSLPAVLDEVISVTGVYSYPYDQTPSSPPTDRVNGVIPNPLGPILLFGNALKIGGTATIGSTGGTGGAGGGRGGAGRGTPPPDSTPTLSSSRRAISRSMPIESWARLTAAT